MNATSIGSDGTIYLIGRQSSKLSAVAPIGNLLWDAFIDTAACGAYDAFVFGTSMPAIAPDGGVILGFRAINQWC